MFYRNIIGRKRKKTKKQNSWVGNVCSSYVPQFGEEPLGRSRCPSGTFPEMPRFVQVQLWSHMLEGQSVVEWKSRPLPPASGMTRGQPSPVFSPMYTCPRVYMCTCVCVYTHRRPYVFMCACGYIVCTEGCVPVCTDGQMPTCVHMGTLCALLHACVHTRIDAHKPACIWVYMVPANMCVPLFVPAF